jgi:hypothetical protein
VATRITQMASTTSDQWLRAFCESDRFFKPCGRCSKHNSARESQLNFWDCAEGKELCSVCLTERPREAVIQVGDRPLLGT